MYYSYFGLSEAPFSIAVNPRYLYMSPSHRDALAHLLYGVGAGGGFILLTGEVGTGKTTINRCLLEQLPDTADLAIVLNPALDARDLLATVCEELGILPSVDAGMKNLTDALHRFLLENHRRGRKTVLMIDEAQHLSFDVLEQIRLLTNLETHQEKLLHIILIGQPELAARLAQPELRQLNQRITARYDLTPLSPSETGAYIRHRLHVAGLPAGRELFSDRLIRDIHSETAGVPRLINLLCDRLLLGTYGQSADRPDRRLLKTAAREVLGAASDPVTHQSKAGVYASVAAGIALLVVGATLWWTFGSGASAPSREFLAGAPADAAPPLSSAEAGSARAVSGVDTADAPWHLDLVAANERMAQLYDLRWPEGDRNPCGAVKPAVLECYRLEMRSWSDLAADGRPALLELFGDQSGEARALFLGLDGDRVTLATRESVDTVRVSQLSPLWTGTAWRFWRRPPGVDRSLGPGDRGEDVAIVTGLFARLDDQLIPLGNGAYTPAVEERVRLFQLEQGLQADGLLSERTLRRLVLVAGEDVTMSEARRRLAGDAVAAEPRIGARAVAERP